jgi:hypothetical protein
MFELHPTQKIASFAAIGVLTAAGLAGVAVHESSTSHHAAPAPAQRIPTWHDSARYDYYHGPHAAPTQHLSPSRITSER